MLAWTCASSWDTTLGAARVAGFARRVNVQAGEHPSATTGPKVGFPYSCTQDVGL